MAYDSGKPEIEQQLSTGTMGSLIIFGVTPNTVNVIDRLLDSGYSQRNIRVYDYQHSNLLSDEKYNDIERHFLTQPTMIETDWLTYTTVETPELTRYNSEKFQQSVKNNVERRKEIRRTQRELKKKNEYMQANELDAEFNSLRWQHNSWQPVTTRKVYHKILIDLEEVQQSLPFFETFLGRPKDSKSEQGEWMKDYLENRDDVAVRHHKNVLGVLHENEISGIVKRIKGIK